MPICKKRNSDENIKSGKVNGKQRHIIICFNKSRLKIRNIKPPVLWVEIKAYGTTKIREYITSKKATYTIPPKTNILKP